MNTAKIANILGHFKAVLGVNQIVLTGSTVLELNGLFTPKVSTDLDILLINPSNEVCEVLKRLQDASPAKTKANNYPGSTLIAIFEYDGYKLDFFTQTDAPEFLYCESIKAHVTTVGHIVRAKQKSNRPKDWTQLGKIAESIYTEKQLKTSLVAAFL